MIRCMTSHTTPTCPKGKLCLWWVIMLSIHLNRWRLWWVTMVNIHLNRGRWAYDRFTLSQPTGYKQLWFCDLKFQATYSPKRQRTPACPACPRELLHTTPVGTTSDENASDNRLWGCVPWRVWLHREQYGLEIGKKTTFSMIPGQAVWILATSRSGRLKKSSPENPAWLQKWPYYPEDHWEAWCHSKMWQRLRARLWNGPSWVWLPHVATGKWPCWSWSIACLLWGLSFPSHVTGIVCTSEACSGHQITLWA